jgi:hypothetical protein
VSLRTLALIAVRFLNGKVAMKSFQRTAAKK